MSTTRPGLTNRLLYRPTEAAELLSIGRSTVYELISEGALKSTKVRGSLRIRRSDLEQYVADLEPLTR